MNRISVKMEKRKKKVFKFRSTEVENVNGAMSQASTSYYYSIHSYCWPSSKFVSVSCFQIHARAILTRNGKQTEITNIVYRSFSTCASFVINGIAAGSTTIRLFRF